MRETVVGLVRPPCHALPRKKQRLTHTSRVFQLIRLKKRYVAFLLYSDISFLIHEKKKGRNHPHLPQYVLFYDACGYNLMQVCGCLLWIWLSNNCRDNRYAIGPLLHYFGTIVARNAANTDNRNIRESTNLTD